MDHEGAMIFNRRSLHEITDGDEEVEREFMALFVQTAERCLPLMKAILKGDTTGAWREAVHELRGASANVRAEKLAALCAEGEALEDPVARMQSYLRIQEGYNQFKSLLKL